jgi:hypothetical protein
VGGIGLRSALRPDEKGSNFRGVRRSSSRAAQALETEATVGAFLDPETLERIAEFEK